MNIGRSSTPGTSSAPTAVPDQIRFTDALPQTRSGGIKGDTTTLEDFTVIASLSASDEG